MIGSTSRFYRHTLTLTMLTVTSIFLAAAPSPAQVPLMQFSNSQTDPGVVREGGVFGFEFLLTNPYIIDGLGIWDEGGNGLTNAHAVGLWDQNGTSLLASGLVDNAALPVVTPESTAEGGRWLMVSVSPLLLQPGRYVVGASYQPNDTDAIRFTTSGLLPAAPEVIFVVAREESPAPSLTFPTNAIELGGYFGPTVFGAASAAPEPCTGYLAGGLLSLLAIPVRRRIIKRR
jgi:hypothetical protein